MQQRPRGAGCGSYNAACHPGERYPADRNRAGDSNPTPDAYSYGHADHCSDTASTNADP
jgi:hypothetical protein